MENYTIIHTQIPATLLLDPVKLSSRTLRRGRTNPSSRLRIVKLSLCAAMVARSTLVLMIISSHIGGETKILAVDRNIKFSIMIGKLAALCGDTDISFKYQLPGSKSERDRFVEALNSGPSHVPETNKPAPNNVDFLFGLDKGVPPPPAPESA
ncbi:hypothetical protein GH714_040499 [Hevea brasiliensis]|uniref:Uncharacterized protein n=1 Tax=Hevea brasiliensis TaxID=3981 RepID=A0A6A6L692_HEVBR|nr:hypothetical protein GH714_040499 [Hevea brasiliensis]